MKTDQNATASTAVSKWIPRRRIAIARGITIGLLTAGVIGGLWWWPAFALVVPGLGAAWVAFILTRIRSQLSATGAGWEHRIHELVTTRLGLAPGSSAVVLDIGCGEAGLIAELLNRSPALHATGVDLFAPNWDYSQASCEARISALGHHATFQRMDAAHLDFPEATFDAVVSVMCFHEVHSTDPARPSGPLLAVKQALRVLRPGGRFVLIDRFADPKAYGPSGALEAVLGDEATDITTKPLVASLGIPWPLNSRQSLDPVQILTGTKRGSK
jgi:SAM-dependent methyltransferase